MPNNKINIHHGHFQYSTLNKSWIRNQADQVLKLLFQNTEENNKISLVNEIKNIAREIQNKINNVELSQEFIQDKIETLNKISTQSTVDYINVLIQYIVFMSVHRDILSNGKRSRFRGAKTRTLNNFLQQINKKKSNKGFEIFIPLIKFYACNWRILIDLGLNFVVYKDLLLITCKDNGDIFVEINNKSYKVILRNNELIILHDQGCNLIDYYKDNLDNLNELIKLGLERLVFDHQSLQITLLFNEDSPVFLLNEKNKQTFFTFYRNNYVELTNLNLNRVKFNNINYVLCDVYIENNVEQINNIECCYIDKLQEKTCLTNIEEDKYFGGVDIREQIYQLLKKMVDNYKLINFFKNLLGIDLDGTLKKILPNSTVVVGDSDGSIGREIIAAILTNKILLTQNSIDKLFTLMITEYNALLLDNGLINFQNNQYIYDLINFILKNAKFVRSNIELIFLGDSVLDRFTNNKLTHMRLRQLLVNFCGNTIYIKGNHDDVDNILNPKQKDEFTPHQFAHFSKQDILDVSLEYHVKAVFKNCYYDSKNYKLYIHNGVQLYYNNEQQAILKTAFGEFNLLSYVTIEDLVKDINLGVYKSWGTSFRPTDLDNYLVCSFIKNKFKLENFTIIHGHTGYQEYKIDSVYNLNSRTNNQNFSHLPACVIFEMKN